MERFYSQSGILAGILMNYESPIFIGGTGRCGTSILAEVLGSNDEIFFAGHETKFIVEPYGLNDLTAELCSNKNSRSKHYAIRDFIEAIDFLHFHGFKSPILKFFSNILTLNGRISKFTPLIEKTVKIFPNSSYSAHAAVSRYFGREHFETCIKNFIENISIKDSVGIIDNHGLQKPFFHARDLSREKIFKHSKKLIDDLYKPFISNTRSRWIDDTPSNLSRAEFLLGLYPEGQIIHIVRHPIQVYVSMRVKSWAPESDKLILLDLERKYRNFINLEEKYPGNISTYNLENLVENTEKTLLDIASYLNLESMDFENSGRISKPNSPSWRDILSEEEIDLAYKTLDFPINHYGYEEK